jgi:rubrerythrin
MTEEFSNTAEVLGYAIQMETDGRIFYTKAAQESGNMVGEQLYTWLAKQEDRHKATFEVLYNNLTGNIRWKYSAHKPERMGTIFNEPVKRTGTNVSAVQGEIDAAAIAIEMELKSRDFYKAQASTAQDADVKQLLMAISAEEQGHYLSLIDYREYITSPSDWFTRSEHHLLDGA